MIISASEQATAIRDQLKTWADVNQPASEVLIAGDQSRMWGFAYNASNKLRMIVCCTGEDIRGDFATAAALGRVDRQFSILVSRGRVFSAEQGAGLIEGVQNAPPLFDVVEAVRDQIRSLLNVSSEFPIDYKGFDSHPIDSGVALDAFILRFSAAADLPRIESGEYASGTQQETLQSQDGSWVHPA